MNNEKSQYLINQLKDELESGGYKVITNFKSIIKGKNIIINLIAISKKGVYLIKTKNLNAVLKGDYKDKVWTYTYHNNDEGEKSYELYNTMKQLYKSSLAIQNLLSEYKIRPLTTTVFGNETQIKLTNAHPYSILKVKNMKRFFESKKFKEKLTDLQVEEIYNKLMNESVNHLKKTS